MPNDYVVDAHALIWFAADDPQLGARAGDVMRNPASKLFLPSIALAEACWVVGKARTKISSAAELIRAVEADPRFVVVPLTVELIKLTLNMPAELEMDDRQIVATVKLLAAQGNPPALLTKDEKIVRSALVPIVW